MTSDQNSPSPNPALAEIEVLVGNWEMELSNASFLPDPSVKVKGNVTIEWSRGNAVIVMFMGARF